MCSPVPFELERNVLHTLLKNPQSGCGMRCEARTGRAGLQPGRYDAMQGPAFHLAAAGWSEARRAQRRNCIPQPPNSLGSLGYGAPLRICASQEDFRQTRTSLIARAFATAIQSRRPAGSAPACGSAEEASHGFLCGRAEAWPFRNVPHDRPARRRRSFFRSLFSP
jgi:hypothetical protein